MPLREFNQLLQRKGEVYDDFSSATLRLRTALASDDLPAMEGAIRRREELIREIDALDRQLGALGRSVPVPRRKELLCALTPLVGGLEDKIKEIDSLNSACTLLARDRHAALERAMKDNGRQQEGLRGYVQGRQGPPKFLSIQT